MDGTCSSGPRMTNQNDRMLNFRTRVLSLLGPAIEQEQLSRLLTSMLEDDANAVGVVECLPKPLEQEPALRGQVVDGAGNLCPT